MTCATSCVTHGERSRCVGASYFAAFDISTGQGCQGVSSELSAVNSCASGWVTALQCSTSTRVSDRDFGTQCGFDSCHMTLPKRVHRRCIFGPCNAFQKTARMATLRCYGWASALYRAICRAELASNAHRRHRNLMISANKR